MIAEKKQEPLSLSNLAFCRPEAFCYNSIAFPLVIDEPLVLGGHQVKIVLRTPQARGTQSDSMTLAERTARPCSGGPKKAETTAQR
jgi:hypothetical protein